MWIPKRQCLCCRKRKEKNKLLRIVCMKDGGFAVGEAAQGRGAYLCRDGECAETVIKKHLLARAFHREIDQSAYELIKEAMADEY